jgi:ankyrin repeat protein
MVIIYVVWYQQPSPTSLTSNYFSITAEFGFLQLSKILLENGSVDINASCDPMLGTALNIAAYHRKELVVQLLIEHGADPYLGGNDYHCALEVAISSSTEGCVEILLSPTG